jgi:two-component system chemotaxis sensor kinase CheA
MAAPDPMAEMRAAFFVECEELLEGLQAGLDRLATGEAGEAGVHGLFRAVHSIKGGAGAFGLSGLVAFAHQFEGLLAALRGGQIALSPGLLALLFRAADHLADLVSLSRRGEALPEERTAALLAEMAPLAGAETEAAGPDFAPLPLALDLPPGATPRRWQITFRPRAALFAHGHEPAALLRALAELGRLETRCCLEDLPPLAELDPEEPHLSWEITLEGPATEAEVAAPFDFVEDLCTLIIRPLAAEPPEAPVQAPPPPAPAEAPTLVRVDLGRVERLMNLVGELVINQAMLGQSLARLPLSPHGDTMKGLEEFQRLTRDIQDSVMMIRAQPIRPLFQRMARTLREACAALGKEARLETRGEMTEVDRTVIDRLTEPLTHMVRNALDHGIEPPEGRRAAGKPAQGRITLSAAHRAGRVVIEVSDDGAGIDRAAVLARARAAGLVPPGATPGPAEIERLLFLPGFSTAEALSDLSGRGVGMDVVASAIGSLGGRLSLSSTPSQGTAIRLSLPLTLAVMEGMVVEVAGETVVLPLTQVSESLALAPSDLAELAPGRALVRRQGSLLPLADLGALLGYRAPLATGGGGVALLTGGEDQPRRALLVDRILDQRQVVIKGLDESFARAPGVAAATILGDGSIALILDPGDLPPAPGPGPAPARPPAEACPA